MITAEYNNGAHDATFRSNEHERWTFAEEVLRLCAELGVVVIVSAVRCKRRPHGSEQCIRIHSRWLTPKIVARIREGLS